MRTAPQIDAQWHASQLAELYAALSSSPGGLSLAEARRRLQEYGPNHLPESPPPPWWRIVLRQFRNPLIYVLGLAAAVSLAIGESTDAAFIAAVLGLNAAIGTFQEWRAEQSARALRKLLQIRASVQRDQEISEIEAAGIVPGDVVWLESGNRVPADIRLIQAQGLQIDESLLTGESLPVAKDALWSGEKAAPLADRRNAAFAGTTVTRGRAKGLVAATGASTAVGRLALDVMASSGGQPPLLERMERFTRLIGLGILLLIAVIGVLAVALGRFAPAEMFLFAVALAVSAIPEGLPVAMTVALAIATTRMAKRGVIVRRLTAVEGLGSCTLVATDKTGTLTVNELTVREIRLANGQAFEVTGQGFVPDGEVVAQGSPVDGGHTGPLQELARAAVLCNEADLHHRDGGWVWRGDTVDIALLAMAHKLGWRREAALERHPQVNQIPFEPEHRFAASFNRLEGRVAILVKGAPERVFEMCSDGRTVLDGMQVAAEEMAAKGYRVLALAQGSLAGDLDAAQLPPAPSGLSLLGLAGMIDPLRSGVRQAVQDCRQAGVEVAMITGDHRVTALAIGREMGLAEDESQVVLGSEVARQSPQELCQAVRGTRIFARVSPHQKLQIVQAAQQAGHFVAVTGDGVNDAPALRAANIGIAMGRGGTDVAREAAELVLSDDNFATIVSGIDEGRVAYDNIRKVIYLLISTGAAELVLVGLAVLSGLPLPLLPVQLLWLNLVTNGIQDVALAFEPGEDNTLKRKPRPPQESIFNRLMMERTVVAACSMGLVAFVAFWWMLQAGWSEASSRNALLLLMVLFENVHIGNCRSETKSALKLSPLRSPILLAGAVCAFLIHLGAIYLHLGQQILGTEPVSLTQWGALAALAVTIFPVMELHKLSWAARQGSS